MKIYSTPKSKPKIIICCIKAIFEIVRELLLLDSIVN